MDTDVQPVSSRVMAEQRTISIPRAARYFVAGDPSEELRDVWFVMHGYGQLADEFLAEFEPHVRPGRIFVAPEGLSRFYLKSGSGPVGASWMTKVERQVEVDDYVRFIDAVYGEVLGSILPPDARVTALGFSQGGATACRWAALGYSRVDRLVTWAGGVPPDLDLAAHRTRLERMDLTLVVGSRDAYIDERRLAEEATGLNAGMVPHRVVRFEGGHRLDRETLERLLDA